MPTQEKKPKCPECETELVLVDGELPETCSKCGFTIKGFDVFARWAAAFEKTSKKKTPPKEGKSPLDFFKF